MKMLKRLMIVVLMLAGVSAFAQKAGIKTNLLYDATTTMNLGVEFGLARKWTLDVSGNYNPWDFDGRKMKHWLVQPGVRYWLCEKFNGHFFGLHTHGGQYNFGGMLPWGFSDGKMFGIKNQNIIENRYQGWLVGAGISYGYQWILGNRWSLEATLGLGYAYLNYKQYPCGKCGKKIKDDHKNYFGPTKIGISLIYIIK